MSEIYSLLILYWSSLCGHAAQNIAIVVLNLNFVVKKDRFDAFLKSNTAITKEWYIQITPIFLGEGEIPKGINLGWSDNKIVNGLLKIGRGISDWVELQTHLVFFSDCWNIERPVADWHQLYPVLH